MQMYRYYLISNEAKCRSKLMKLWTAITLCATCLTQSNMQLQQAAATISKALKFLIQYNVVHVVEYSVYIVVTLGHVLILASLIASSTVSRPCL
jgi:hypothetical protein